MARGTPTGDAGAGLIPWEGMILKVLTPVPRAGPRLLLWRGERLAQTEGKHPTEKIVTARYPTSEGVYAWWFQD